jgi:hypothetical protein
MTRGSPLLLGAAVILLAAATASPLDRMSGRYDRHFKNGTVFGEVYYSDDILEIVPLDRRRAYFRARTNFSNGHSCSIHGVTHVEGSELVYRATSGTFTTGARCEMRLRIVGDSIDLVDANQACRQLCGARGGYEGPPEFRLRTRRPIRYLGRLRRSPQYLEALREDELRRRSQRRGI